LPPKNCDQIYNLILKRAKNPGIRPTVEVERSNVPKAESEGFAFKDRYKVTEEIGSGGMSRVYKAKDLKIGETVAVKVLHQHLLNESSSKRKKPEKRFEQEFKATMALGHQNIVRVFDYGFTKEQLPFIVMEYLNGRSLEQLLRDDGRLKQSQFLTVFYQTCSALSHAHVRGVIHRDVKPSNIMLVKTEQNVELVKLLDFGIAKVEPQGEDTQQKLTQTGDVFGSPYYMSPEQCKGGILDARSDIYSLGCVMYQALIGKRPFEGDNAYKTIYMHVNVQPPPFAAVRMDIPIAQSMEAVVMKCLEKEPHMRYQTVQALSLDLQKAAQEDNRTDYVTKQTKSGTFYAVDPNSGKEEPANFVSVLKLLKQAGLINEQQFAEAYSDSGPKRPEVGQYLIDKGVLDSKTLHSAVQCQALIERDQLKIEKAIIALHYCQRSRVTLEEALDDLGFTEI
jgi:Serine/threonine protein kinase